MSEKPTVAIIGGGPAGLMAATILCAHPLQVHLFDRMPSVGRKFLMAGRGGLNLTHSEPKEKFVTRYREQSPRFARFLDNFDNRDLQNWAHHLGIETFIGTSGRVFPKDFKAAPLLRAWIRHMKNKGVVFHMRHLWQGFDSEGSPMFNQGPFKADASILALGGASWPNLGSDGSWVKPLKGQGLHISPLKPSNCGFLVNWSDKLRAGEEGMPLKNISLSFQDEIVSGDLVITQYGLEGTPIYALSGPLREEVLKTGSAKLSLDLKPDLSREEILKKLQTKRGKTTLSNYLRKTLNLSKTAFSILMETTSATDRSNFSTLSKLIKKIPLSLVGIRPIEEAISSAGGLQFEQLTDKLMSRSLPGVFFAGEMLDWEAPTGGYLLQGCFSTGVRAAEGVLDWLERG